MTMMRWKWIAKGVPMALAGLLGLAACATPTSGDMMTDGEKAPAEHADNDDHARSDHQEKRFTDPEERAKRWNDPARAEWQKPEAIVEAMGLQEGMSVADIGVGTGYFLPFLSQSVGETGRVVAVDIEQAMLDYVEKQAREQGLGNIDTVLAQQTESGLEEASVDRILIVNTWHHIPSRDQYARHLGERLTEGGELWVVDYRHDSPIGPPEKHRLEPAQIVEELEAGGFEAEVRDLGLERQYVVVGRSK
jgi:SAM-dependent methyltransferase